MKDGVIQQVGEPLEVYSRPNNRFVAGFIGSPAMNFVEAEVTPFHGTLYIETAGFKLKIPAEKARRLEGYLHKKVTFGIRPEDLPEASSDSEGETINAIVEVIEPIGSEVFLNVKAGPDSMVARVDPRTQVKVHKGIILKPIMENMHVFDMEDEKAILVP